MEKIKIEFTKEEVLELIVYLKAIKEEDCGLEENTQNVLERLEKSIDKK